MQAMKSTITQLYDYRQSVIPQDLRRWHASEEEIQAQLEVLSRNHAFERDAEEVLCKLIIVEGIMSIQAGANPKFLREKLLTFVAQRQRAESAGGGGGE